MDRLFVANRGEIAVRIVRAARDLEISSVVPFAAGDRDSLAVALADDAVDIGHAGTGVRPYLDTDALVRAASAHGCDALHPGYGFLSESAQLARECQAAGITFVGPSPEILEVTGDKVRAREAAVAAGLPVPRATGILHDADEAGARVDDVGGFPLFVKAARGGGGRGLRLVHDRGQLTEAIADARREAGAAFGHAEVYLEEAVRDPRHVEVQVLGDAVGGVVGLGERDCSVQRRHQKLVEIAPAPHLATEVRDRLHHDAVALARALAYCGAGTVEFLLDPTGDHRFIEVNPRLQVEHTITEEVTGVDIVTAQLQLARGRTLASLGLDEAMIRPRGSAIQLRVTAEDPTQDFRPAVGTMTGARLPAGPGVRVDGAEVGPGIHVRPEYDSLLLKLVVWGPDLSMTVARARRALDELSLPGIRTSAPFLHSVLAHLATVDGPVTTAVLDDHPEFARANPGPTAGPVAWVAERTVHRDATTLRPWLPMPPDEPADSTAPVGSRTMLRDLGPQAFAAQVRADPRLQLTDTSLRDAHQSLLATRVRTVDLVEGARRSDRHLRGLYSLEAWGGATHDAALRFGLEDPWERLERLRAAAPETCLQMLLRGRNIVAYGSVSDRVLTAFVREAARTGVDVFRIFDALNNVDRMTTAVRVVVDEGAVAEGTLCYTGDLLDPAEPTYTLDHYLGVAEGLVRAGAHVLALKDMAGVLSPTAATMLVSALRKRFDTPVHLHTHDSAGGQLATYLAAVEAGVDIVDVASAPMAGGTSQPSMAALVDALRHTPSAPIVGSAQVQRLEPFWATIRRWYTAFDAGHPPPDGLVRQHQMPGGQVTNLHQQATAMALDVDPRALAAAYQRSSRLLGDPIKVTPTSKVVGDLALYLLVSGADAADIEADPARHDLPASVVDFLRGDLGVPPGGWPEPLRTRVLAVAPDGGPRDPVDTDLAPDMPAVEVRARLDTALLPEAARCRQQALMTWGELTDLPTEVFLHGLQPGRTVRWSEGGRQRLLELVGTAPIGDEVAVTVRTEEGLQCIRVAAPAPSHDSRRVATADAEVTDDDVTAPVPGVVSVGAAPGDPVRAGDVVATVEAMKLATSVRAPHDGTVDRVWVATGTTVAAGAPLVRVLATAPTTSGDASLNPPVPAR